MGSKKNPRNPHRKQEKERNERLRERHRGKGEHLAVGKKKKNEGTQVGAVPPVNRPGRKINRA